MVRAELCPDALRDAFGESLCSGAGLRRHCFCQRAESEGAIREEARVAVEGVGGRVVAEDVVVVFAFAFLAALLPRTLPPLLRPHN